MKITIITAANASYFNLLKGLIASILANHPDSNIELNLLDIGLTAEQHQQISPIFKTIINPDWNFEFPEKNELPVWFKALTARPFLPQYFPGYEIYIWLDADTWVQNWQAVELLIHISQQGHLAIIEETFGKSLSIQYTNQNQQNAIFSISPESIQRNILSCYHQAYGEEIALKYAKLPPINCGVFAMRGDVSFWQIWSQYLHQGLQRKAHKLIEQQAFNLAIRQGKVSAHFLPTWCNWLLIHQLPWWNPESRKFVVPGNPSQEIGILHLADLKQFARLTFTTVSGGFEKVPITYPNLPS